MSSKRCGHAVQLQLKLRDVEEGEVLFSNEGTLYMFNKQSDVYTLYT